MLCISHYPQEPIISYTLSISLLCIIVSHSHMLQTHPEKCRCDGLIISVKFPITCFSSHFPRVLDTNMLVSKTRENRKKCILFYTIRWVKTQGSCVFCPTVSMVTTGHATVLEKTLLPTGSIMFKLSSLFHV